MFCCSPSFSSHTPEPMVSPSHVSELDHCYYVGEKAVYLKQPVHGVMEYQPGVLFEDEQRSLFFFIIHHAFEKWRYHPSLHCKYFTMGECSGNQPFHYDSGWQPILKRVKERIEVLYRASIGTCMVCYHDRPNESMQRRRYSHADSYEDVYILTIGAERNVSFQNTSINRTFHLHPGSCFHMDKKAIQTFSHRLSSDETQKGTIIIYFYASNKDVV